MSFHDSGDALACDALIFCKAYSDHDQDTFRARYSSTHRNADNELSRVHAGSGEGQDTVHNLLDSSDAHKSYELSPLLQGPHLYQ